MSVTLTGIELETYAGSVLHDYILGDYFGTSGMKFFPAEPTEVINQPIIDHGDAKHLDDGSDHTNEDASITGSEIPLWLPIKASNTVKKRTQIERPDLKLLSNLGESHGKSLSKHKTEELLQFLALVADTAGNIIEIDADATDGTAPVKVKNGFKEAAKEMDEAEVDAIGRRAILKSAPWYELIDQDGVISKDFGGQANRQTAGGNGAVINYLNFDIKNCGIGFGTDYTNTANATRAFPAAVEFDMTDVIGVLWQERSWALRHQENPNNSIEWIGEKQIWLILSRMEMGAKELLTEGIWVLKQAA